MIAEKKIKKEDVLSTLKNVYRPYNFIMRDLNISFNDSYNQNRVYYIMNELKKSNDIHVLEIGNTKFAKLC